MANQIFQSPGDVITLGGQGDGKTTGTGGTKTTGTGGDKILGTGGDKILGTYGDKILGTGVNDVDSNFGPANPYQCSNLLLNVNYSPNGNVSINVFSPRKSQQAGSFYKVSKEINEDLNSKSKGKKKENEESEITDTKKI